MRPSFVQWATSKAGLYLFDKKKATLAHIGPYQRAIFEHVFPGGDGVLPYNQIIWSAPKKSGKSEWAAGLHQWFAIYIETPGEQYVLANDLRGSNARVFRAIWQGMEKNPHLVRGKDWRKTTNEIVLSNGTTITAVPSDYRGEAGNNMSFTTVDEPWGIIHAGGVRLMTEFTPVPTRANSTVFYTGYQGFEGQSDFWHDMIDGVMRDGRPVPELVHLDNGDGEPACWAFGRTFVYWDHKPRVDWITNAYLAERRATMPRAEYLRVWENRRVQNTEAFLTAEQWDALPTCRGLHADDERVIVLAADAATKNDSTALVGCAWNEEQKRVEQVYCQIWMPGNGEVVRLTETLGPEIVRMWREHRVAAVYYDPFQMAAVAEICQRAGVPMVEFPQTARRVQADTNLRQTVIGGNLAHYGDPALRRHVLNANTRSTERGLRIEKLSNDMKVDAAVALSMATLGTVETLANRRPAVLAVAENPFY